MAQDDHGGYPPRQQAYGGPIDRGGVDRGHDPHWAEQGHYHPANARPAQAAAQPPAQGYAQGYAPPRQPAPDPRYGAPYQAAPHQPQPLRQGSPLTAVRQMVQPQYQPDPYNPDPWAAPSARAPEVDPAADPASGPYGWQPAQQPMPQPAPQPAYQRQPVQPGWHEAAPDPFESEARWQPDYADPAPGYAATPQGVEPPHDPPKLINILGAVLSIVLIGGVGMWSYRLMVRDVNGVPVIRALETPMRTASETPGGLQTAHQGLAVNAVAAQGAAAQAPQQIAIAPPPVQLRPEDLAVIAPPAPAATIAVPLAAPAQPVLIAEATPLTPPVSVSAADLVPATAPGVSRSVFPRARPAGAVRPADVQLIASAAPLPGNASGDAQAEAVLAELATRMATPSVTDIDPATLPLGTRLVQFQAFESVEQAQAGWLDLARRFPGTLDGRGRIIEQAIAGGRPFYRLRAHGFADEPEARRFCSIFESAGVSCITTLIR